MQEEEHLVSQVDTHTNGEVDEDTELALLDNLKQLRSEAANVFGTTKIMEVPGYMGMLAVEYQYIDSEVTERIAREVRKETKNTNGIGMNLLSSVDTLICASKNVLIRKDTTGDWVDKDGNYAEGVRGIKRDQQVNFRTLELSKILDYPADDTRDVVIGLYGSEHKIVQANVFLSQWLTDKTHTAEEDFLG